MGIIEWNGDINFFQSDRNIFKVVKIRSVFDCAKCRQKLSVGSYCFGKNYTKFCIDCGIEVYDKFKKTLLNEIKVLDKQREEWIKEKDTYKQQNIVANL